MKFAAFSLSFIFAGASASLESTMAESRSKRRLSKEFMHAMREPTIAAARQKARAEKVRQLHENLMSASRKLANNNGNYYQNQNQNQYNNQNQNQYYNQNQYQNNNQNQNQYQNQNNNQYQYQYADNSYDLYGDMANWEEAPFDMSSRAFKYAGCAAIKTYDQDRAYENGNPMVLDTYAVFRLCPADKCNDYSMTGCGKNYGEYAVEMKTYLSYVLGFYEERYDEYCEYCEPCDWEYQAESKSILNQCYSMQSQRDYQNMQSYYNSQAAQNYANGNVNNQYNGNAYSNSAYNNGQGFSNYQQYYNGANSNVNYNGYANNAYSNYNNNGNANANADAGGDEAAAEDAAAGDDAGRKLGNYYYNGYNAQRNQNNQNQQGYNYNQQYQNNQAQNQQVNSNSAAYGYYDENGDWVDGQSMSANGAYGYWGEDGIFYPYDEQYYGEQYVCMDGSTCDYCTFQNEQLYQYCDDYICGDYYTYCSDLYTSNAQVQEEFDPLNFLECQQWENNYGKVYYIGPHCGTDHYTISLGVFKDENCVEYVGDDVSLSTVLGYTYKDEDIFKLPKECIACDGAEEYENYNYQENQQQQQEQQSEGRYGAYVAAPTTTEDGIVAMCAALYSGSAQCNMNMNNFAQISRYMSAYELDQESRYCAFIENIVYGAYDESGDVILKPEQFDFADWRNAKQYKKLRMSAGQAIGLSFSIILCVALAATAAITNRALTRQSTPWKPKRGLADSGLSRQNSGIVMGRSRSGPGAAPLI